MFQWCENVEAVEEKYQKANTDNANPFNTNYVYILLHIVNMNDSLVYLYYWCTESCFCITTCIADNFVWNSHTSRHVLDSYSTINLLDSFKLKINLHFLEMWIMVLWKTGEVILYLRCLSCVQGQRRYNKMNQIRMTDWLDFNWIEILLSRGLSSSKVINYLLNFFAKLSCWLLTLAFFSCRYRRKILLLIKKCSNI